MATFKCKMCDAILNVREGTTICECEYCGTRQTVVIDGNDAAAMSGGTIHKERKHSHEENESVSEEPFLRRAFMFLEDGDWGQAKEYCEKALDRDPENGRAYLGKLMADLQVNREANLADVAVDYRTNNNFKRALHFGDSQMVENLKAYSVKAAYKAAHKAKNEQFRKNAEKKYNAISYFLFCNLVLSVLFVIVLSFNALYVLNCIFIAILSVVYVLCIAYGSYLHNFLDHEKQNQYLIFKLSIINNWILSGAIAIVIHDMKVYLDAAVVLVYIILSICSLISGLIGYLLGKRKADEFHIDD